VGGRVAGVGYTAVEAERLGRRNRLREKLTLTYVEPPGDPLPLSPLLEQVRPVLARQEMPVYLVGGAVRDALLDRPSHDLDFVVPGQAIQLAYKVANRLGWPAYTLDQERDLGRVVAEGGVTLDFARFRKEDLAADLSDRDFTINAMALPAEARNRTSVIDLLDGQADLAAGLVRQVHEQSLANDPVRALRAVRLALQLNFQVEPATAEATRAVAARLGAVSVERVRDELVKLIGGPRPDEAIEQMAALGLLAAVLPEIAALEGVAQSAPHTQPVLGHTLSVLAWLAALEDALLDGQPPAEPAVSQVRELLTPYLPPLRRHLERPVDGGLSGGHLLRLGALFHDVGKKETQRVEEGGRIRFFGHDKVGATIAFKRLNALRLSSEAARHVRAIVAGHTRPLLLAQSGRPGRRAVYRFFRNAGLAGLDIGLLSLADHLGTYGRPDEAEWPRLLVVVEELYSHYFERYKETIRPALLLDGHTLMEALGLLPGPEIGRLLRLIEEAQAAGEITTREEALRLAREAH
ncbi:MAG: HDIG domain-containing protein, partial [Chloroflexi bacterium]|nr:HDIG domain-containing protein [Chloroflexota bacterium]